MANNGCLHENRNRKGKANRIKLPLSVTACRKFGIQSFFPFIQWYSLLPPFHIGSIWLLLLSRSRFFYLLFLIFCIFAIMFCCQQNELKKFTRVDDGIWIYRYWILEVPTFERGMQRVNNIGGQMKSDGTSLKMGTFKYKDDAIVLLFSSMYAIYPCTPMRTSNTHQENKEEKRRKKTHANLINILWVIPWAAAITVAAVTRHFTGFVSSIDSTSSELNFFPRPFGFSLPAHTKF